MVGLWTTRVKNSGAQPLGTVLRSCAKDMTVTIVIINPRQEIVLECGWRHTQKWWAENLMILKKHRSWGWTIEWRSWVSAIEAGSWKLTLDHAGRQLSSLPLGNRELSSLSLSWELDLARWRCSWVFRISTDRDLKHHKMNPTLVGSA